MILNAALLAFWTMKIFITAQFIYWLAGFQAGLLALLIICSILLFLFLEFGKKIASDHRNALWESLKDDVDSFHKKTQISVRVSTRGKGKFNKDALKTLLDVY